MRVCLNTTVPARRASVDSTISTVGWDRMPQDMIHRSSAARRSVHAHQFAWHADATRTISNHRLWPALARPATRGVFSGRRRLCSRTAAVGGAREHHDDSATRTRARTRLHAGWTSELRPSRLSAICQRERLVSPSIFQTCKNV